MKRHTVTVGNQLIHHNNARTFVRFGDNYVIAAFEIVDGL